MKYEGFINGIHIYSDPSLKIGETILLAERPDTVTIPSNPVQTFIRSQSQNERVLSALNGRELNKTTLAEIANVGYSIIHRTDLALYDTIPPKLNAYFKSVYPEGLWNVRYLNYKKALLEEHKAILSPRLWLKVPTSRYDTWTEFRELVADTQMEFSKLFLINPSILQHFESGKTKYLPIVIMNRLRYFGMDPEQVAHLNNLPVGNRTVVE